MVLKEEDFERRGFVKVDESNYEEEVVRSEEPVLVEFWRPKCKDCEAIAPDIERTSEKVKFCHFKCPSRFAVLELGVRNLPSFHFYKKGKRMKVISKDDASPENVEEALRELAVENSGIIL